MNLVPSLPPDTQAILLLTSHFSKAGIGNVKPLTNSEWLLLNSQLENQGDSPGILLNSGLEALMSNLILSLKHSRGGSKITYDRVAQLLGRRHSLALAVEKWQRANIWIVAQDDREYPKRVIDRMDRKSAPVLFGCGNKEMLNAEGLAVVGSRNASKEDLDYAGQIGAKAAAENIAIISGCARGIDESSMLGALHADGKAIGILPDNLFKAATTSKWREGLLDNRLTLISPFYPEAGFSVGNAMQRNKYIYCLAKSALVVHSGKKGGTMSGAKDNIHNKWITLWIKRTSDGNAGNEYLKQIGGRWVEPEITELQVSDLMQDLSPPQDSDSRPEPKQGVFDFSNQQSPQLNG